MRVVRWILIIVIGLSVGVWLANRRSDPQAESVEVTGNTEASVNTAADAADSAAVGSNSTVEATPPATDDAAEPIAVAPAEPVAIASLTAISYLPAANEQGAFQTIRAFYTAYNQADAAGMIKQFDLSVSVTQAVQAAIAEGQPRPTSVSITKITTRSDSSQLAEIQETRSDASVDSREVELVPASSGMLIVAYRMLGNDDVTGGFSAN